MMNEVVKKVILTSVTLLAVLCLLIPVGRNTSAASNARTLKELRSELNELKKKQKENTNKQNATKNEIASAKDSVSNKQNEIMTNQQIVIDATNESIALEEEIKNGKEELANLVESYQIAMGDNVYLEYIFEATSYENLVYRYAVMEQIMNYQEERINEWNDKIEYNTQLKIDLEKKEVELNKQIDELSDELDQLDNELETYFDESMDIKDEISSTQELIDYYVEIGCKEDEDLNACVSVKGDTKFIKPLKKGTITSYFGYRTHPVTGKKSTFHTGTDIGGNSEGTNVYSIANGMVGKIIKKASCGGNQVYIYHTIKGKKYTSAYLHLLNINVKIGDKVTSNTIIGTVGGGKSTSAKYGGYDTCTTGAHLHLGIGTGWYGSTYTSYSKWKANLLNAKDVLGLPTKGVWWYSR